MNSLQSTALEPTRSELAGLTTFQKIGRLIPAYGLAMVLKRPSSASAPTSIRLSLSPNHLTFRAGSL